MATLTDGMMFCWRWCARRERADKLFDSYWKDFDVPFLTIMEKQGRYKKTRIQFFLANFNEEKHTR